MTIMERPLEKGPCVAAATFALLTRSKSICCPCRFRARLYRLQNGCISRQADLACGLLEPVRPKPLKKQFLPGPGDIDVRAIGHDQVTAFALYISDDLVNVDQIGVVNPHK